MNRILDFQDWKKENTKWVKIGFSKKLVFVPTNKTVNSNQLAVLYQNYLSLENFNNSSESIVKECNLFPAGSFKK
jgi:hypothetical protein